MTTYADRIVARLNGDGILNNDLAGGAHLYDDSGRNGLNRTVVKEAYDEARGLLKPVCIVIETEETPDGQVVDSPTGRMSTVTPVYTWIYDHGDAGYGRIAVAYARIYTLLHTWRIPGGLQVLWVGVLRDRRAPNLKNAAYYRAAWQVHGWRTF